MKVANSLGLEWIDGNKLYHIERPAGGCGVIPDFPMHDYLSESDATPKFVEHLQERLAAEGVKMAAVGGFDVIDTHKDGQMLSIMVANKCYIGYMDAVIVPYGSGSYYQHMRVGVEQKQSDFDKQQHKEEFGKNPSRKRSRSENAAPVEQDAGNADKNDPDMRPASSSVPGPFSFSGRSKGQSTMELLAAYSIADQPVDVLLTDAHTHHILRLRDKKIIYWANLSTPEALDHLAGYLKQADASLDIDPASIPEDAKSALDAMWALRPQSALAEQAEALMSVTPLQDRLKVALQFMQTWTASGALHEPLERAMPPEIAAMYE
ncbi:g6071 [Coccomyxa elongata]